MASCGSNPDVLGRKDFKVHEKNTLANDVKPRIIARGTPGFLGESCKFSQ